MKKIVFFSLEEGRMGGVAKVNFALKEALEAQGFQVIPLYLRSKIEVEKEKDAITVRECLSWKWTEGEEIKKALRQKAFFRAVSLGFSRMIDKCRYQKDLKKSRRILKDLAPDFIITSHYLLLDGIPEEFLNRTVHHVHTSFAETIKLAANRNTLFRYQGKISYLWLSRASQKKALEEGLSPSYFLYNPLFSVPNKRVEAEKNQNIVFLSRFSEEKRLDLAVELISAAWDKIPEAEHFSALFYGSGPEEEALKKAIGTDPRFRLMGQTDDPYSALKNARISLNTSRFEGFSISVLECAAAGIPTLSFHFGEAAPEEILDEKTGFLVPMDDKEAFVSRLVTLLTEDETVKELSVNAKKFAAGFHKEKAAENLIAILQSLPLDKREKER